MTYNKIIGEILTNESYVKPKTYTTFIFRTNPLRTDNGCLYQVNDSSINFIKNNHLKQGFEGDIASSLIYVKHIDKVLIRRKGSVGKGMLIGGLAGTMIGVTAVLIFYEEDNSGSYIKLSRGLTAGSYAIIGMGIGIGIGGSIGGIKIKIPINGNIEKYNKNKRILKSYSVNYK